MKWQKQCNKTAKNGHSSRFNGFAELRCRGAQADLQLVVEKQWFVADGQKGKHTNTYTHLNKHDNKCCKVCVWVDKN